LQQQQNSVQQAQQSTQGAVPQQATQSITPANQIQQGAIPVWLNEKAAANDTTEWDSWLAEQQVSNPKKNKWRHSRMRVIVGNLGFSRTQNGVPLPTLSKSNHFS